MPYIHKTDRKVFDEVLNQLDGKISIKGELEYCIYKLMLLYMKYRDFNYSNLHDTVYSAQHCADEFRRRLLDKREDEALKRNGDIYEN